MDGMSSWSSRQVLLLSAGWLASVVAVLVWQYWHLYRSAVGAAEPEPGVGAVSFAPIQAFLVFGVFPVLLLLTVWRVLKRRHGGKERA